MFLLKTINKHGIDMKHVLHIKVGTIGSFTNDGIGKLYSESTEYVSCLSHVYLLF